MFKPLDFSNKREASRSARTLSLFDKTSFYYSYELRQEYKTETTNYKVQDGGSILNGHKVWVWRNGNLLGIELWDNHWKIWRKYYEYDPGEDGYKRINPRRKQSE